MQSWRVLCGWRCHRGRTGPSAASPGSPRNCPGGGRCPRAPRDLASGSLGDPTGGSRQHPLRLRPARAQHKSRPPTGCSAQTAGLRCGREGAPSHHVIQELKLNKAIASNTAAYSLNRRYFCNPCSASALSPCLFASVLAPPPDGKALQHQGRRRHGPAAFRGRAAPGPRRSSRGTPGTRALTPGPAGRPGQQEAAPLLPALPGDGAVTPRELLLSAGQGWGRRRAGGRPRSLQRPSGGRPRTLFSLRSSPFGKVKKKRNVRSN